ncbi:MAG: hypothetical protein GX369_02170 [Euryarchaeota archaeon]|nr:hypothetical protein [Euryarchaeota archaeon]
MGKNERGMRKLGERQGELLFQEDLAQMEEELHQRIDLDQEGSEEYRILVEEELPERIRQSKNHRTL